MNEDEIYAKMDMSDLFNEVGRTDCGEGDGQSGRQGGEGHAVTSRMHSCLHRKPSRTSTT